MELLLTLLRLRESHGTLPLPLYKSETSSQPLGRIKGGCYIGQNPVMDPFSSSALLQPYGSSMQLVVLYLSIFPLSVFPRDPSLQGVANTASSGLLDSIK